MYPYFKTIRPPDSLHVKFVGQASIGNKLNHQQQKTTVTEMVWFLDFESTIYELY